MVNFISNHGVYHILWVLTLARNVTWFIAIHDYGFGSLVMVNSFILSSLPIY
ncbi:hypothetical protein SAMN05192559_102383 [Halobacillus karajensis]|nr:hypothetical protein SAMN05192559_102383 [Halobacillus karajensis]